MGFELINELKKKRGWTNIDLSKASGVPKATIDKITAGATTNPNFDTVWSIAEALGCSVDQFKTKKSPISAKLEAEESDKKLKELLDNWETMNDAGHDKLLDYSRLLLNDSQYLACGQFDLGASNAG